MVIKIIFIFIFSIILILYTINLLKSKKAYEHLELRDTIKGIIENNNKKKKSKTKKKKMYTIELLNVLNMIVKMLDKYVLIEVYLNVKDV